MDPIQPILANALTFAFEKATIEGKITISALILVSMVSWSVIITKGRQILKARAMSKKFLAAYRDAKDPMSLFREKQEFSGAPAFEVYAMGCGEVEYHLENNPVTVKGQKRISVESFQAVQVALERAVSTEALSLEKGMIILTTAVAGGPFIGLLGTVVGVMVTFAAIAASGDVNINAIAPGMAAALLATTAGLAVAIPALFGYNYLGSKVKELSADMHVFADEFLARMNEIYGD